MNYVFTLDSVFKFCLRLRTKLTNQYVLLNKAVSFTHANVLLSYVDETVFAWKTAFLQDSCQSFYGTGQLTLCQSYLKMHAVGEGPGASL